MEGNFAEYIKSLYHMEFKTMNVSYINFINFSLCLRFKTKHQLANHSKRHDEYKPLECNICSKRFRQMYNLTVHMRSHNNIYPYTCKYCDRKFRHTSSLKTHERTHTDEKPYACKYCEYKSTNWPNLNKHSTRIHCKHKNNLEE